MINKGFKYYVTMVDWYFITDEIMKVYEKYPDDRYINFIYHNRYDMYVHGTECIYFLEYIDLCTEAYKLFDSIYTKRTFERVFKRIENYINKIKKEKCNFAKEAVNDFIKIKFC